VIAVIAVIAEIGKPKSHHGDTEARRNCRSGIFENVIVLDLPLIPAITRDYRDLGDLFPGFFQVCRG
jgi:hypothetical protein